jgi:hypothetical protein
MKIYLIMLQLYTLPYIEHKQTHFFATGLFSPSLGFTRTGVHGKKNSWKMNRPRKPTTFVSSFLGHDNTGIFTMTYSSEHGKSLNIDWTFAVLPRVTKLRRTKAS